MTAPFFWIRPEPWGIHIAPADVWIDPARAVPKALVTHGHADHARGGHGETIATPATLAIMKLRYATSDGAVPVEYGESIGLGGGVTATFLPAGHVLGSAQILLEHAGERVIITGDYKRAPDPTCAPFAVTPCDIFITEATFGLPVFTHPPIEEEIGKLLAARAANPDSAILVGAYALAWLPWLLHVQWPVWATLAWFGLMGLLIPGFTIGWTLAKEANPPQVSGIATSVVNTGIFLGAGILQPLVGWVLDASRATGGAALAWDRGLLLLRPARAAQRQLDGRRRRRQVHRCYLRQNAGVNSTSTASNSSRPISMAKVQIQVSTSVRPA